MNLRLSYAAGLSALFASSSAVALPPQSGSSFSTGPSSSHLSVFSGSSNPAVGKLLIDEDKRFRMNYTPGIALSVELGAVDNFADDLDELIDIIDDPDSSTEAPSAVVDRFNRVLEDMGREGYIKNEITVRGPFLPFYFNFGKNGTVGLDFQANADVALSVLDDELVFDELSSSFVTSTSIYLKSGIETSLSASYSHLLYEIEGKGNLYVGAKAKLIQLELSKQVTMLQDLDGREIEDVLEDEYDRNLESSTNIALDIGVLWDADKYRVGLTLENANSPTFDYGAVGENCDERLPNSAERNSCEVAAFFVAEGRLRARETHEMHARFRADALWKFSDSWVISSSLDLAEFDDVVGFENQWLNLATAKDFNNWLLSDVRVGYRSNLTGTEQTSASAGLTLFKSLTLDIEYGLDSVTIDDSTAPRRIGFALGFEQRF